MHLWLGLATTPVIIILGVTGCMLAFETEIRNITTPVHVVAPEQNAFLDPLILNQIAEKAIGGYKINYLEYPGRDRAAVAYSYDEEHYHQALLNPYTGAVMQAKDMNRDFFRIVLDGHYYLWLPPKIGQPVIGVATLIFLLLIVSGLILWWPKNRSARKQRFRIKWYSKWKRVNYDLHSVLGFYITWVMIFIVVTGLVWAFEWFAKSFYAATSLGGTMPEEKVWQSSQQPPRGAAHSVIISAWTAHLQNISGSESIAVGFPVNDSAAVEIAVNHRPGTYYDREEFMYDQYSGALLNAGTAEQTRFKSLNAARKIQRLNYDVHVGAALGLPGKMMAFLASLIAASLPVTGFAMWLGRKKKGKSAPEKPRLRAAAEMTY